MILVKDVGGFGYWLCCPIWHSMNNAMNDSGAQHPSACSLIFKDTHQLSGAAEYLTMHCSVMFVLPMAGNFELTCHQAQNIFQTTHYNTYGHC